MSNNEDDDSEFNHPNMYHGAPDTRDIKKRGLLTRKRQYNQEDPEEKYYFTDNYKAAKTYADPHRSMDYQNSEPGVIKAKLRMKNPKVIHWGGNKFHYRDDTGNWHHLDTHIEQARKDGHDGVIVHKVIDDYHAKGKPSTVKVIFNNKNYRLQEDWKRNEIGDWERTDIVHGKRVHLQLSKYGSPHIDVDRKTTKPFDDKTDPRIGAAVAMHAKKHMSDIIGRTKPKQLHVYTTEPKHKLYARVLEKDYKPIVKDTRDTEGRLNNLPTSVSHLYAIEYQRKGLLDRFKERFFKEEWEKRPYGMGWKHEDIVNGHHVEIRLDNIDPGKSSTIMPEIRVNGDVNRKGDISPKDGFAIGRHAHRQLRAILAKTKPHKINVYTDPKKHKLYGAELKHDYVPGPETKRTPNSKLSSVVYTRKMITDRIKDKINGK